MDESVGSAVINFRFDDAEANAKLKSFAASADRQYQELSSKISRDFSRNLSGTGVPVATTNSFRRLSAEVIDLSSSSRTLRTESVGLNTQFSNMGAAITPLLGAAGIAGLLKLSSDLATQANQTNTAQSVLNATLARTGGDIGVAQEAITKTATALGLANEQVTPYVTNLLRIGTSAEKIDDVLIAGGASALAFGKSAAQGVSSVSDALTTRNSALLNTVGVAENIGMEMEKAAAAAIHQGEAAANQAATNAGLNIILRATAGEVAVLDQLTGGLAGKQSEAARASFETRQALGEMLIPLETLKNDALVGVLGLFNQMPGTMRANVVSIGGVTTGVAALVAGASALRLVLLPLFAPPTGLLIAGAAVAAGLGTALFNAAQNANKSVTPFKTLGENAAATQDAIGSASDKESLAGSLESLATQLDGKAKRSVSNYAAEIRTAKGDVDELKKSASDLVTQVTLDQALVARADIVAKLKVVPSVQGGDPYEMVQELQDRLNRSPEFQNIGFQIKLGIKKEDGQYAVDVLTKVEDRATLSADAYKLFTKSLNDTNGSLNAVAQSAGTQLQGELQRLDSYIFSLQETLRGTGETPPPVVPAPDTGEALGAYEALIAKRDELQEAIRKAPTLEAAKAYEPELAGVEQQIAAFEELSSKQTENADAVKQATEASSAWIQRITSEAETGLKPAAQTIGLLTQALNEQYQEQERLAKAGLIDGAQYAVAEEKIRLLTAALENLDVSTLTIEPEVSVARDIPPIEVGVELAPPKEIEIPDVQAMVLEPVELPIPDTSAWVDYEEVISNLIDTQNRLMETSRQEAEEAATLRYVGDVIAAYERANGPLNSYQEAMDALSQAGLWNAETQKIMAENFGVTVTSVEAADEALSGITEKLLSLGSDADPAALRAIRVELDALKGTGFIDDSVLDSLYSYLGTLEGLVAPLQTLREEVRGLYSDQELTAEQLTAINDILAEFEPGDADSYEETREALRGIGEEANLSGEQMQVLLDLLSEANLTELEFDTSKAEDATLNLLESLEGLIASTGMYGEVGVAAAAVVVDGYAAVQEAQEATRVAQEAADVARRNGTEANKKASLDAAAAEKDAWRNALAVIGQGVSQLGSAVKGLEGDWADMAGTALQHAGSIATAFATDPTGVTGMIAIATAGVDLLIKAFNHAAEAAKRTAEQTKNLRDITKEASSYSLGAKGIETQAELINLETRYKSGQMGDAAYFGGKRNLENQQARIDLEAAVQQNSDWYKTEVAKLNTDVDPAKHQEAVNALVEATNNRYNALQKEYAARLGANNAQMNSDLADAARRRAEEEEDKPAPGGSIAGKRARIGELRQKQETSTSAGEVQRLQSQIEGLEADIKKMLGEGEGSAKKGSIADLEKQVSDLRKKQQGATSKGEYAGYQSKIDGLNDRISKIKGEAAESIAKGSLDYYEKLISDLKDQQGRATSQSQYEKLQRQIEGYEAQMDRIRGEVEKSAAKGTINYYEDQIRLLKEKQGNTKSQSEYARLESQIEGYEKQIARIRGESAEGAAKGTLDYYEEQIRSLKDAQGKTKNAGQYAKLQDQIEGYEKQIARIRGEVEQGNVKGSIDYYEELVRDLKTRQGRATDKAEFAQLQQEINKYERAIADIQSGASDNLKNSVGYYEDIIGDLKRRQKDARTEAEFEGYQKQIDGYQAEVDRISGEIEEAYGKGTVGYYEGLIGDLRKQQKQAKTPKQHADLQSQIEQHQAAIDKIEGDVRAETIKGSVAYYENEISKLRERQKATTTRQEHRELETQIDAFQKQILAITEDAGAEAVEGTLAFYEARIQAVKEAQQFAKTPGEYADLEDQIAGYQGQIDTIKGLNDLEGSINYYQKLLSERQEAFNATVDDTQRAALGAEIQQLETTLEELRSAAEASQSALDAVRERYQTAAEDFASTFKSAMQNASDFEGFFEGLQGNLRDTVRNAILEGANSADDFQGLSDSVSRALSDGTVTQAELTALQDQATQLAESRKGVYDLLDDLTFFGESLSDSAKGMRSMNQELTNVPSGLKLAEQRFAAAAAESMTARALDVTPPPELQPLAVPNLAEATNLRISDMEQAALESQHRRMLEQQALYLKERQERWQGATGKTKAEQDAYYRDHAKALGEDVMGTSLEDLWKRVGESITSRGSYYQEQLREWQEGQEGRVNIMPVDPLADPLLTAPGRGERHIMPYIEDRMKDFLPNLETDKMRAALGVGNYGFTPGLDRSVGVDISDRLEKVLRDLADRSGGMTIEKVDVHGIPDVYKLRDELLSLERGINRGQHGSSVAK